MKQYLLVCALLSAGCAQRPQAVFLPENTLHLEDRKDFIRNGMTEEMFEGIIDHAVSFYEPEMKAQGGRLTVVKNWDSSEVNAGAKRGTWSDKNAWLLMFYGGLARRPEITPDGFALVVCHEIGHLLGGAPYYPGEVESNEGQSDYFATLKCARKIWADGVVRFPAKSNYSLPQQVTMSCTTAFRNAKLVRTCTRSNRAAVGLARLLGRLIAEGTDSEYIAPSFLTPDKSVVEQTDHGHPAAQCRLDTMYAGSLGRARPRCWYNPEDSSENLRLASQSVSLSSGPALQ